MSIQYWLGIIIVPAFLVAGCGSPKACPPCEECPACPAVNTATPQQAGADEKIRITLSTTGDIVKVESEEVAQVAGDLMADPGEVDVLAQGVIEGGDTDGLRDAP